MKEKIEISERQIRETQRRATIIVVVSMMLILTWEVGSFVYDLFAQGLTVHTLTHLLFAVFEAWLVAELFPGLPDALFGPKGGEDE